MNQNAADPFEALAALSTGIYVLTTGSLTEPYGMIVSWVTQAGYEPPLVLAAVRANRQLHDLIPAYGCFGLSVLAAGQEKLVSVFKKKAPEEKFQDLNLTEAATGAPLLTSAAAWLDCRLVESYRPGDHTLYLGRVEAGQKTDDLRPMTIHDYGRTYSGRY